MIYSEVKRILYNSVEMEDIRDDWKEELPFLYLKDSIRYAGFLYCVYQDQMGKVKRMLSVEPETERVLCCNSEELKEAFQIKSDMFYSAQPHNYDIYFTQKEIYETLFSEAADFFFCGRRLSAETADRLWELTQALVSDSLFQNVIYPIGKEFYDYLQDCCSR